MGCLMRPIRILGLLTGAALGVGLLLGCQAAGGPERSAPAGQAQATSMPELSKLYADATAPHRRAVRKPIRDQQERALRMLAVKSQELAEQTRAWDSDTRLMSLAEPQRDPVRRAVGDFRNSLNDLSVAAGRADLHAVRTQYARASNDYRNLLGKTSIPN